MKSLKKILERARRACCSPEAKGCCCYCGPDCRCEPDCCGTEKPIGKS